jgi:hypothetical protein
VVQRLSQHNVKSPHIAIFKSFVKQNNSSNKTCRYDHDFLQHQNFICRNSTVHELSPWNEMWILTFNRPPHSYFWFFKNNFVFFSNCLIKSCSSFEDVSAYKVSWSHVDWSRFLTNIRSLNAYHFGMTSYGIKYYGVEVIFNGMNSLLNFDKSVNWFKS